MCPLMVPSCARNKLPSVYETVALPLSYVGISRKGSKGGR